MQRAWIFFISLFFLIGCLEFKNSAFDTQTHLSGNWNSRFQVPSYNLAGGDVVRFGIFTDSHQNYTALDRTITHMGQMGVHFAVMTGDFSDVGTRDEFEIFYAFLSDATYPVYVAPGNHDLTTVGRKMYKKFFGPENSALDTSFGRMIFFNNNPLELRPETVDYDFLASAVGSANNTQPLFIFQHQDPYNYDSFTVADQIQYQLTVNSFANDVYIFHGHLHSFSRSQVGGNAEVFQVARVERERWALVEVDNTQVRVSYCKKRDCRQVFP